MVDILSANVNNYITYNVNYKIFKIHLFIFKLYYISDTLKLYLK
jgi:hypothetical protein